MFIVVQATMDFEEKMDFDVDNMMKFKTKEEANDAIDLLMASKKALEEDQK